MLHYLCGMEKSNILKGRRLKILRLLGAEWHRDAVTVKARNRMNVTDIIIGLRDSSQSSVSQDLGMLRKLSLVSTERDSKLMFYELADDFEEKVKNLGEPDFELNRAIYKGKNRKVVVAWLQGNPGSQVKDIAPTLSRSTVSQELRILRKASAVEVEKRGRNKYYSLCSR
jgi:DNA-binding transcriptional ArsR family regulator